jgi:hypothetical protein
MQKYKRRSGTTFFCFSPPVMVATFAIEVGLLLYTIIRYRLNPLTRIITATLLCLAVFQLAEFNVCEGEAGLGGVYSRLGYIAITFLPPLGIHLVQTIAGRGSKYIVWAAYAMGITLALIFGLNDGAFSSHACGGNYAVFQLADSLGGIFFGYYYFWLLAGISMCLYYSVSATKRIREALTLQTFGYLSFILPTGIVNALHPSTINGIPSIMCGFAVIYALILAFGIAPRVLTKK